MADAAAIQRGREAAARFPVALETGAEDIVIDRDEISGLLAYIESLEAKERKLDLAMTALDPKRWPPDMQEAFLSAQARNGVEAGFAALWLYVGGADVSRPPAEAQAAEIRDHNGGYSLEEERQAEDTPERKAIRLVVEAIETMAPLPGRTRPLEEILDDVDRVLSGRPQS